MIKNLFSLKESLASTVVTIGNFDGVHLGHREIFRRVKEATTELGGESVVVTFVPHPLKVLNPQKSPLLINTYAEKEKLIEASGIDYLVEIPFDSAFAAISARAFVEQALVGKLGVKRLIVGHDYAFGRNREGNIPLLKQLGDEFCFKVDVLEPISNGSTVYSSTAIRAMISRGEVRQVVPLLGRHFSIAGVVVHGHHRGQGLGFPTANLQTEKELIPTDGVYAVKVKVDDSIYNGACNIGNNPTFDNELRSIEVFLLDFDGNLYGKEIRLYFIDKVREERTFPDFQSLQEAIKADIGQCRRILGQASVIDYQQYLKD